MTESQSLQLCLQPGSPHLTEAEVEATLASAAAKKGGPGNQSLLPALLPSGTLQGGPDRAWPPASVPPLPRCLCGHQGGFSWAGRKYRLQKFSKHLIFLANIFSRTGGPWTSMEHSRSNPSSLLFFLLEFSRPLHTHGSVLRAGSLIPKHPGLPGRALLALAGCPASGWPGWDTQPGRADASQL